MIVLSKHLYIVDEVKWCVFNAILRKRIKEAIFWITEYYESGYKKETWELLYVIYSCFYFKNYTYYIKKLNNYYKKWKNTDDFMLVLNVVNKLNIQTNIDCMFFKIVWNRCKYKDIKNVVCNVKFYNLTEADVFVGLIKSLKKKKYKNIWFFIQHNFDKTLNIVTKFYKKKVTFHFTEILDKKMQLLMFIYKQNNKNKNKIPRFNLRIKKSLIEYYKTLIECKKTDNYKVLKERRLYSISDEIGCFHLERYNICYDELREKYLSSWESMIGGCPYWESCILKHNGKINKENTLEFENEDDYIEFNENYNYEIDEQSLETQNKSIKEIQKYSIKKW